MRITIEADSIEELANVARLISLKLDSQQSAPQRPEGLHDLLISEQALSTRTKNALLSEGITTVATLIRNSPVAILSIPGLGIISFNEINAMLNDLGLPNLGAAQEIWTRSSVQDD